MKSMCKKIGIVLVLLLLLLKAPWVSAAPLQGFMSDCLDGVKTENENTGKLTFPPYEKSKIPPRNDTKTWIFACISTDEGQKCTTGDRDVDIELFGTAASYDDLSKLLIPPPTPTPSKLLSVPATIGGVQEGIQNEYVKGTNPKKTTLFMVHPGFKELDTKESALETAGYGKDLYWYDAYPVIGGVTHSWYWLQELQPVTTTELPGSEASQQMGKFQFIQLKSDINCSKVQWDPMGFVFDVQTLYPVKSIPIVLFQQQENGVFTQMPSGLGVTNPFPSLETNGQYSFLVPAGMYKMNVNSPYASLSSASNSSKAIEVFGSALYSQNAIVEEVEGKVAVSHIPVTVSNKSLLITEISLQDHHEESLASGNLGLTGRLSHPLSKVHLILTFRDDAGADTVRKEEHLANSLGAYSIIIPQITDGKYLTEITMSFELNSKVYPNAAPSKIKPITIFPIPPFVDGVAYDEKGKPIPNAIVALYPSFSEKPMYLTVADAAGHFTIGSQHIPRMRYALRYKKATGEVMEVSTQKFIMQNTIHFSEKKINPYVFKNTSQAVEKKVQEYFEKQDAPPSLEISRNNRDKDSGGGKANSSQQTTQTNIVQIILLIILLILGIGSGVWWMRRKKT